MPDVTTTVIAVPAARVTVPPFSIVSLPAVIAIVLVGIAAATSIVPDVTPVAGVRV